MNRVFVDTSGFYAALNRRDAHFRQYGQWTIL